MNPFLAALLAAGGFGRATSALTKPWKYLNKIPWAGDVYRPDQALPLDYTAEARGRQDRNREYLVSLDEQGVGVTNRGRTLLPKDVQAFQRLERGPEDWQRRQAVLAAPTPRTRSRQARLEPMVGAGVIANAPGRADLPVAGDMSWALHRLKQAAAAGLIGEVPTPDDRDLPAAWRDTSARLAGEARRGGYNLTGRLGGKLDPQVAAAVEKALKSVW